MTAQPNFLQFPRGVAALQLVIGPHAVTAELYGPRQAGGRPQMFLMLARPAQCYRTSSAYPNDLLLEKLWINGACVSLTRKEADQVDELLREVMPAALPARAVA